MTDAQTDRARRAFDHLRFLRTTHGSDCNGRWVAIKLSDGSCDQRLYDSKAEAIRFQLHETQCAYFFFPPDVEMDVQEVGQFLAINEQLYDAGMCLSDPDTYVNPEMIRHGR